MANTKHSAVREIIIDRLLKERRGYCVKEMLEIVNEHLVQHDLPTVSSNTIRNDIEIIQCVYKKVLTSEKRGRDWYYQYNSLENTIFTNVLTHGELSFIQSALNLIRFIDPMQGTMMYKELPERVSRMLGVETEENPVVIYDNPPTLNNLKKFRIFYEYILKKIPAYITYHTKSGKIRRDNIIHPYFLLNRENDWYLLCHNESINKPAEIHLSAIKHIEFAEDTEFIPNKYFPLQDYYKKVFSKK